MREVIERDRLLHHRTDDVCRISKLLLAPICRRPGQCRRNRTQGTQVGHPRSARATLYTGNGRCSGGAEKGGRRGDGIHALSRSARDETRRREGLPRETRHAPGAFAFSVALVARCALCYREAAEVGSWRKGVRNYNDRSAHWQDGGRRAELPNAPRGRRAQKRI
jgi:hypothetical protein